MRLEKLDIKDFVTQHYLDEYFEEHKVKHLPKALHLLDELRGKLSDNAVTSEKFDTELSNEINRLKAESHASRF
jgi:phosphoglycolate phosphatase-like HAD superfamily hydrolase